PRSALSRWVLRPTARPHCRGGRCLLLGRRTQAPEVSVDRSRTHAPRPRQPDAVSPREGTCAGASGGPRWCGGHGLGSKNGVVVLRGKYRTSRADHDAPHRRRELTWRQEPGPWSYAPSAPRPSVFAGPQGHLGTGSIATEDPWTPLTWRDGRSVSPPSTTTSQSRCQSAQRP